MPIDTTQLAGQIGNYEALGTNIIQALMDLYGAGMSEYQKLHAQAVAAGINPAAIQAALTATVAKLQADAAASGASIDPKGLIDQAGNVIPLAPANPPAQPGDPTAETFTTQPPHLDGFSIYHRSDLTPPAYVYAQHGAGPFPTTWTLIEQ